MPSSPELFAGTAAYYARYRPPYPDQIFRHIVEAFALDGSGRLLDVGCGPGTFTFRLRPYVAEVVAVDASREMIEEGQRQASIGRISGIDWRAMPAESISTELGQFKLVTIASAFHWMDRDAVLARCYDVATSGGGLVISSGIASWWESQVPWHKAVIGVVKDWLGPERRTSQGICPTGEHEPFEQAFARSQFDLFDHAEASYTHVWDIESIIGFLYSTSFANRALLGHNLAAFEEELQDTLSHLSAGGRFQEDITFDYFLARKPTREPLASWPG
jgi:SAM-dependent methyltransferase